VHPIRRVFAKDLEVSGSVTLDELDVSSPLPSADELAYGWPGIVGVTGVARGTITTQRNGGTGWAPNGSFVAQRCLAMDSVVGE
jgi:hypothetical protein